MPPINEAHVLIMATNRFEESELFGPREILLGKGAKGTIASLSLDEIMGTVHDEPGKTIKPDVLILIISALSDKATAIEALKKGANGFLCKPFTDRQLTEALEELLRGAGNDD